MSQNMKRAKALGAETIMKSAPFKAGVADYRAGTWREFLGESYMWRKRVAGQIYEAGRYAALVAGPDQPISINHYRAVITDWPTPVKV